MDSKTIDVAAFNAAFAAALPGHVDTQAAKSQEKLAGVAGFAGLTMPSADDIKSAEATFCAAWPEVRATINTAVSAVGWFMPGPAAKVKAWMAAFDKTIVPVICGKSV